MSIQGIYDNLYGDCQKVYGHLLSFLLDNFPEYLHYSSEDSIEELKKKCSKYPSNQFGLIYQEWYSRAILVLGTLLPERKEEFIELYSPAPKRKELTVLTYTISDAIDGIRSTSVNPSFAMNLVQRQIDIVKSLKPILESRVFDIKQLIENDVFEGEISSAEYLLSKGFARSAGAICGVLLEKHLKSMLLAKGETIPKKASINDYNVALYKGGYIDGTQNKFLLYLGDLRNKCDHSKDSEPTKSQVTELIEGTRKVMTTYC